jgi:hypothetical protein
VRSVEAMMEQQRHLASESQIGLVVEEGFPERPSW